jgi:hypothetical protein
VILRRKILVAAGIAAAVAPLPFPAAAQALPRDQKDEA